MIYLTGKLGEEIKNNQEIEKCFNEHLDIIKFRIDLINQNLKFEYPQMYEAAIVHLTSHIGDLFDRTSKATNVHNISMVQYTTTKAKQRDILEYILSKIDISVLSYNVADELILIFPETDMSDAYITDIKYILETYYKEHGIRLCKNNYTIPFYSAFLGSILNEQYSSFDDIFNHPINVDTEKMMTEVISTEPLSREVFESHSIVKDLTK